jgi:CO dehydrogenase/acetyl-CoA synthase alpha subunit
LTARWSHLAQSAFQLQEAVEHPSAGAAERIAHARRLVDSALESFGPGLDPVEDFEAYTVRRLLLALQVALGAEPTGR